MSFLAQIVAILSKKPDIQFQAVNASADGDNTVITGKAGKLIRVTGFVLVVTAAGLVRILDGSAAQPEYARWTFAANGGAAYAGGPEAPAFDIAVGQDLVINNAASVDTTGFITYEYMDPTK